MNYSVSNGRTTVNIDADVNTSLSTQSAPVATAVRCDYTNEDITAVCDAFANTFATYADIKPSADSEEFPGKHEYTTQTAYVIISAIDGSIYNPWLGTLEQEANNKTNK